jgi:hypothetical protein
MFLQLIIFISLSGIEVLGFDYDYTIACYTERVQHFIYQKAFQYMLDDLRYPEALKDTCFYDPEFSIRVNNSPLF